MAEVFFSVIIPSLNEEINLPILLQSLNKQKFTDYEVIVTDCFSTDTTKEKALVFKDKLPQLHFIQQKVKNVCAARNFGASKANGKYLVFFDADVEVEGEFLAGIKEHIDKYNLDALTVWNRPKNAGLSGKFVLALLNVNMTFFQKIKPAANGPCIILKKEMFDRVHGFDEAIVFGEDFDIIQRVHKLKARFAVFKKPILYVSSRRFEKEGVYLSLRKSIKAIIYQLFVGPIKKPIFDYEMGGQYYENKK